MGFVNTIWNSISSQQRRGGAFNQSMLDLFLFYGKMSDVVGGQMPNLVGEDFITVAGAVGSETFQAPNTAEYIAADTEYFLFTVGGVRRTVTTAEMIGYDTQRTIIKYDSYTPCTVREIVILKPTTFLSNSQVNQLMAVMDLNPFWTGVWKSYGSVKENRTFDFTPWGNFIYYPMDLTLTVITNGINISLTGNVLYETEIWVSTDNVNFYLETTLAPGIETYDYMITGTNVYVRARFKEDLTVLNAPTTLASSLITGGVQLTWNDNNTEADSIEIWANIDNAGYALLATVLAGVESYGHVIEGPADVDYHIRAKEGTLPVYSAYSTEINQIIGSNFDAATDTLITAMIAAGDSPSAGYQTLLDDTIVALKAANLFDTRFDVFVPLRGNGRPSTKLNWIKRAHDATEVDGGNLTYANAVGYRTNGTSSYLRTNFNPSINSTLSAQNDCSFIVKSSGTLRGTLAGHGGIQGAAANLTVMATGSGCRLNSVTAGGSQVVGWTAMSRDNSANFRLRTGATSVDITSASVGLPNVELYALRMNYSTPFYVEPAEVLEFYAHGKQLSQAEFNTLQTIMNTYFAGL